MVYIRKWTQFESETVALYAKSPRKARYTVRFVPESGKLVLKVTDDTTCLMYKTHSAIILNRFESLNLRLLSSIANVRRRPVLGTSSSTPRAAGTPALEGDDPMTGAAPGAGTPTPASPPPGSPKKAAGKGGKKKKKGKR